MDISKFISSHNTCAILFTNSRFEELNEKITQLGLEKDMLGKILVKDIDSDSDLNITELHLKSIPLVYIYKNKKLIEEVFGNYNNICDIIRLHF